MRALALPLLFLLSGCAGAPRSCAGLGPASATAAVARCLADAGDRGAQFRLATMLETGAGATVDLAEAARYYGMAAADVPPTTAIYQPGVGKDQPGRVLLLNNPNAGPGLAAAKFRLGLLRIEGRGVRQDREAGVRLIEQAADLGYGPARDWIATEPAGARP